MEEIIICGIPHQIVYRDQSENDNMGKWLEKSQKIIIDSSMAKEMQQHTLLHEILHCIFDMQGDSALSADENFVNRLSTSILNSSISINTTKIKGV